MGVRLTIYEDTLQKIHDGDKHAAKHTWWKEHGISVIRTRFDGKHDPPISFGDYYAGVGNIACDTKSGLEELSANLGRDHERFKREVRRANDAGYLLVVLVETDEAECVEDVRKWVNSHCRHCSHFLGKRCDPKDGGVCLKHGTKKPLQGETMAKQMMTMELNRSVRFEFVPPELSAKRICELLGVCYD